MKKQRHTSTEIAAKLEEAEALIAGGKLQSDVAKALGVSVMTYHRWRKARQLSERATPVQPAEMAKDASQIEQTRRISELQLENSRLRRLVTDLLLEKINLEEDIQRHVNVKTAVRR